MIFSLPGLGKEAIPLSHFPTKHQAFIFRAAEYVPTRKIADILCTSEENVEAAMRDMGLPCYAPGDVWLEKGYITIIRRMWHILPYEQLLELLEMDSEALAVILREEDFLDVKLGDKPICERVCWRELTEEELEQTKAIKEIMNSVSLSGKAPFDFSYSIPSIKFEGKENFETRMIYAFSGLYQHAFDVDSESFISDEQLGAYQKLGINGIWTQGVLSQLAQYPFEPSVSEGFEQRIKRMREFSERLDKFGIKLYLYINEPRSMPKEFFDKIPHLRGHVMRENACLCTSTDEVKKYLSDSIESICRSVPLLGGFFTITRSENVTNCYSHLGERIYGECNCPRCKTRSVGEVIGDTVGAILCGARRVSDDIKVFAWSWRWDGMNKEIIRHLPKGTILLSQSELGIPYTIGGISDSIVDYSMSIIGPGERAKEEWSLAKELGLDTAAKVQINTTWEASTVPALPLSPSIDEHISDIRECGVKHLLLSWTLGGYPSENIAAAAKFFYEKCEIPSGLSSYREAEKEFSKAFKEFPFHVSTLYKGIHNAGPSNLLFETKTGYDATMTCFAYDDVESWRSIYPINVFEEQFEKLCLGWQKGLNMLPEDDDSEKCIMAHAAYCLFKSSLNQIKFIRARDEERWNDAISAAKDELFVSERMLELMNKNAAIGYEAANHYYFSKGQLAEKIINCHYVLKKFNERQQNGDLY